MLWDKGLQAASIRRLQLGSIDIEHAVDEPDLSLKMECPTMEGWRAQGTSFVTGAGNQRTRSTSRGDSSVWKQ